MIRLHIFILFLLFFACADSTDFSDTPNLEFREVRENVVYQSLDKDTFFIDLYVEDANGDLGGDITDPPNVFMIDQRDSSVSYTFQLPKIPDEGTGNGIAADITLLAIVIKGDQCCIYPDGTSPCTPSVVYPMDTIFFDTYLIDNAGHESNHVMVGPVYIRCD